MASEPSALFQGLSGALLVGLAGFLFLYTSYFQRFQHAAASPQTKTSLSFAYGIGLLLFTSIALCVLHEACPRLTSALHSFWVQVSPVPGLSAVFVAAPAAGLILGFLGNVIGLVGSSGQLYLANASHPLYTTNIRARMRLAALGRVASKTDDRLLATLWRAVTLGKLVQITLKGRKVYIGSPLASGDPSVESQWLKIVPIASGYRDSESLVYIATTDYRGLFDELAGTELDVSFDRQDLGILIAWSEISSLTIYEPKLEDFFGGQSVLLIDEGDGGPSDEPETASDSLN